MRQRNHDENGLELRVALAYYKYGCFCSSHPLPTILISVFCICFLSYPVLFLCNLATNLTFPFDLQTTRNATSFLGHRSDYFVQQFYFRSLSPETSDILSKLVRNDIENMTGKTMGTEILESDMKRGRDDLTFYMLYSKLESDDVNYRLLHQKFNNRDFVKDDVSLTLKVYSDQVYSRITYQLQHDSWIAYLPLLVSYVLLFAYIYFSVCKIQMVKSKCGVACAAIIAVAASLLMASGICRHFDLGPKTNNGHLYPYLASVIGFENIICITHAVVKTSANLDVKSRIAHGLSYEGFSITKNFLVELTIVALGFLTNVPEVEEFCTLALIGLVVDFFMQLFFYMPCLTLDLLRFDAYEKRMLTLAQTNNNDTLTLKNYPPVYCPIWSRLSNEYAESAATKSFRRNRTKSVDALEKNLLGPRFARRRSLSTSAKINRRFNNWVEKLRTIPSCIPRRWMPWRFLRKTRIMQRVLMLITVGWIVWLAIVMHGYRDNDVMKDSDHQKAYGSPGSESGFEPGLKNDCMQEDQKLTFELFPSIFARTLNISLNGKTLTVLPRIVFGIESPSSPDQDRKLLQPHSQFNLKDKQETMFVASNTRWLKIETYFAAFTSCGVFSIVGAFLIFVFCLGAATPRCAIAKFSQRRSDEYRRATFGHHRGDRMTSNAVVVVTSLGREEDTVETMAVSGNDLVVVTIDGRISLYNIQTGDKKSILTGGQSQSTPSSSDLNSSRWNSRTPSSGFDFTTAFQNTQPTQVPTFESSGDEEDKKASIWCMTVHQNLIISAYGDGSIEIYDIHDSKPKGKFIPVQIQIGITHIVVLYNKSAVDSFLLATVRLNGIVDVWQISACFDALYSVNLVKSIKAHHKLIGCFEKTNRSELVTGSDDCTLKVFNVATLQQTFTLYGHDSAVKYLAPCQFSTLTFSCDASGLVCCWDLQNGSLLQSFFDASVPFGSLAVSSQYLVVHGTDGALRFWSKKSGDLNTVMKLVCDNTYGQETDQVKSTLRRRRTVNCPKGSSSSDKQALRKRIPQFPPILMLNDTLLVVVLGGDVILCDLASKCLLKKLRLSKPSHYCRIQSLVRLNDSTFLCAKDCEIFRITVAVL